MIQNHEISWYITIDLDALDICPFNLVLMTSDHSPHVVQGWRVSIACFCTAQSIRARQVWTWLRSIQEYAPWLHRCAFTFSGHTAQCYNASRHISDWWAYLLHAKLWYPRNIQKPVRDFIQGDAFEHLEKEVAKGRIATLLQLGGIKTYQHDATCYSIVRCHRCQSCI